MRKLLFILLFLFSFVATAQIYYVATDGDDADAGTIGEPWGTWNKAFLTADAGDTVYFRGGVYYSYLRVYVDPTAAQGNSGTAANPIVYEGYPADIAAGNWPILDCKLHCDSLDTPLITLYNYAISINRVEYITLKCLEIRNVFQCDSIGSGAITVIASANMTFERIRIHDVGTPRGFWYMSGAWSYADSAYAVSQGTPPSSASPRWSQPDTTKWINCDVWNLCDTLGIDPGNAGDAWKVISYNGNHLYWEGCRAWNYSDDGFDPNNGIREFVNCWMMSSNKYAEFGIEGNGIKTSALKSGVMGYYTEADSIKYMNDSMVRQTNCLGLFCPHVAFFHGVESQYNANQRIYNNTAYRCGTGFASKNLGHDTIGDIFRNNLVYGSTRLGGVSKVYEVQITDTYYVESNNTWVYAPASFLDFDYNPAFSVDSADFRETDSLDLIALFTAPRKADGSLPDSVPMMLMSNSDLIGGGVDIGLPFNGAAPDVGYYEYAAGGAGSPPVADFSASSTSILTRQSITYTDLSTNTPTSWSWIFEGGNPATSILENPTVYYYTAGTFDVSLTATNADGFDSEVKGGFTVTKSYKISIKIR